VEVPTPVFILIRITIHEATSALFICLSVVIIKHRVKKLYED
jgi:hypothetical protein